MAPKAAKVDPKKDAKAKLLKTPKVLKAGASKAGASKGKKKWARGKGKDRINNSAFFTEALWTKLQKDILSSNKYVTPSMLIDKLKINGALARQALRHFREEDLIRPVSDYSHRMINWEKTENFKVEAKAEVEKKEKKPKQEKKAKN